MANTQRLIQALEAYTGQPDSLTAFSTVAEEELGENWTSVIYDVITPANEAQKEKLDHVYHYYGATLAWGEVQGYLEQNTPLDLAELSERIPTLEYWLNFFGDQGLEIINELQDKMRQQSLMEEVLKADAVRKEKESVAAQKTDETSSIEEEPTLERIPEGTVLADESEIFETPEPQNQPTEENELNISPVVENTDNVADTTYLESDEQDEPAPVVMADESEIFEDTSIEPNESTDVELINNEVDELVNMPEEKGNVEPAPSIETVLEEQITPTPLETEENVVDPIAVIPEIPEMPDIPQMPTFEPTLAPTPEPTVLPTIPAIPQMDMITPTPATNMPDVPQTTEIPEVLDIPEIPTLPNIPFTDPTPSTPAYTGTQTVETPSSTVYETPNQQYDANGYPIDNQQYDANGYPIYNQQYDANRYPIDNQQYEVNGYPIDNQQYDANGYPIDNQQYDANGYPIDNQQYDANGYPIDNQPYDANGYPIDNQQYDANGYPIDNQQYDANGYPIDNQQYDANGYPIDNQQYDVNGYPISTGQHDEIGYNAASDMTQAQSMAMPVVPVPGNMPNVPMPGDEHVRPAAKFQPEKPETNEQFLARKAFKQLDFVNIVHAWMDARCISLGNIEIYTYKHYGFLIDAMEQAKKDIKEVLSSPAYYPAIEATRPNGLQTLQNSLVALEKDLEIAYDNAPGEVTALIKEDMDPDEARRMLGMIDSSNKKEYLGPAPDGFEMLDDPFDDSNKI